MPQRSRRKPTSYKRPKAKMPEGDEGSGLTPEERQNKLELFLNDFDVGVKERLKKMDKDVDTFCAQLNSMYRVELMKLPVEIRNMKLSEFYAQGGYVDKTVLAESDDMVGNLAMSSIDKVIAKAQNPRSSARKQKATRGGRPLKTPAGAPTPGVDTPLITPKFDPRLPLTTQKRKARNGETLISMSGSPVDIFSRDRPTIFVPLQSGENLALSPDTMLDQFEIPSLNANACDQLRNLHTKLSQLIRMTSKKK